MAHPIMFSDDDPGLAELRRICLALPGAEEKVSHGRPTFRAGRIFAVFGGSEKLAPGEHRMVPSALIFTPDPVDLPALDEDPRFFVPAYYGPYGGRAIPLAERQTVALREKLKLAESRLVELLQFGEENDAISEKVHRLSVALAGAREFAGYIDVEFELTQFGMATKPKIIGSSEHNRQIERELLREIAAKVQSGMPDSGGVSAGTSGATEET